MHPARYTSAASLHGPAKLGLDVYGRVDSGLICTDDRGATAVAIGCRMSGMPSFQGIGRWVGLAVQFAKS